MPSLINAVPMLDDTPPAGSRGSFLNGAAPLAPSPTAADAWEANSKAVGNYVEAQRQAAAAQQQVEMANGLRDPKTGDLTDRGLQRQAFDLAMSIALGTTAPEGIANRIGAYASKMGYAVDRDSSKISGSEYLNLTHDALPDANLKVRVSSHDLPGHYGPPGDYDVHAGEPRDWSVAWADVVKSLADRVGADVPGPVAAQLAKAGAQRVAESRMQLSQPGFQEGTLQQTYPDEWSAAMAQQGQARSQARRDVAAKYEAANPGYFQWAPYLKPK